MAGEIWDLVVVSHWRHRTIESLGDRDNISVVKICTVMSTVLRSWNLQLHIVYYVADILF